MPSVQVFGYLSPEVRSAINDLPNRLPKEIAKEVAITFVYSGVFVGKDRLLRPYATVRTSIETLAEPPATFKQHILKGTGDVLLIAEGLVPCLDVEAYLPGIRMLLGTWMEWVPGEHMLFRDRGDSFLKKLPHWLKDALREHPIGALLH